LLRASLRAHTTRGAAPPCSPCGAQPWGRVLLLLLLLLVLALLLVLRAPRRV
jgi:hypothetical protein